MKRFLFAAFLLTTTQAFAATSTPPEPTCGKTTPDCQKVVDGLVEQVADLQAAYQAVRQQRDLAQQNSSDTVINNYIQQQKTARQQAKNAAEAESAKQKASDKK